MSFTRMHVYISICICEPACVVCAYECAYGCTHARSRARTHTRTHDRLFAERLKPYVIDTVEYMFDALSTYVNARLPRRPFLSPFLLLLLPSFLPLFLSLFRLLFRTRPSTCLTLSPRAPARPRASLASLFLSQCPDGLSPGPRVAVPFDCLFTVEGGERRI